MVRSRLGPTHVSERRICRVLGQSCSTQRYRRRKPDDDHRLIDELRRRVAWHPTFGGVSRRMRTIASQSAIGGMTLSAIGMLLAAAGSLRPVAGAITQEAIDVLAVLNALRMAWSRRKLADYSEPTATR